MLLKTKEVCPDSQVHSYQVNTCEETKYKGAVQGFSLLGALAGILVLYWLAYIVAPGLHRDYVQGEDRLVEWLTFMFFLMSSVVTFYMIKYRNGTSRDLVYLIVMGSFLLVCAGEEISWGQRILGFETPLPISEINDQKEFNLHNISFEHIHAYGVMSWFISLYGIILPLFLFKKAARPDSPLKMYLSPLVLVPCYALSLIIRSSDDFVQSLIVQYSGSDTVESYVQQTAELQELYWGICLFLSMALRFIFRKRLTERKA